MYILLHSCHKGMRVDPGFLSLSPVDICWGGCLMRCKIWDSVPGLYPLDTSSIHCPLYSTVDNQVRLLILSNIHCYYYHLLYLFYFIIISYNFFIILFLALRKINNVQPANVRSPWIKTQPLQTLTVDTAQEGNAVCVDNLSWMSSSVTSAE